MSQLLAIKERIRTITNLRKVTRAMELVTRTKINRSRTNAAAARRFQEQFASLFARTSEEIRATGGAVAVIPRTVAAVPRAAESDTHAAESAPNRFVIGFLSQKGFCGGFNDRVLAALAAFLKESPAEDTRLVLVGRRNSKWAYMLKHEFQHLAAPEKNYREDLAPLVEELATSVLRDDGTEIVVIFNEMVSILEQRPVRIQLYPPELENAADSAEQDREAPVFEPEPELMWPALISAYINACLERAYWETLAGENAARLISMKNANDNATKMLDALGVEYNKTRQMKITQELSEIVSAFDVLRSIQNHHEAG